MRMGNSNSVSKVKLNYEDVQHAINASDKYIIINTMSTLYQSCLIPRTMPIEKEEDFINNIISNKAFDSVSVIVYGLNANDESAYKKYQQLKTLGMLKVYIYTGGMFEWLLLQDVYGSTLFPTTTRELDILKYKPNKVLNILFIK